MIHFYEKRRIYFAISGLIFLIGIIAMFINGVQLDIQFKGGAILKYQYTGTVDANAAGSFVSEKLGRLVQTQTTEDIATKKTYLVFNLAGEYGLSGEEQQALDESLKAQFPDSNLVSSESSMVEPFFGRRFLQNGMIAIALSSILIVLYVWVRFRRIHGLSAGMMALVALFHDVFVVFFTCVVFKIPIGDSFVAVALSILGYSINDTIVIYDRIRENARLHTEMPVDELVNKSITQSMTRSINTNIAVFASVALVYGFAFAGKIDSIMNFALPMAVGSISGCYSTICIAGPLWTMWQKHKEKRKLQTA
jgi:preprotein translocase subunit SecF